MLVWYRSRTKQSQLLQAPRQLLIFQLPTSKQCNPFCSYPHPTSLYPFSQLVSNSAPHHHHHRRRPGLRSSSDSFQQPPPSVQARHHPVFQLSSDSTSHSPQTCHLSNSYHTAHFSAGTSLHPYESHHHRLASIPEESKQHGHPGMLLRPDRSSAHRSYSS